MIAPVVVVEGATVNKLEYADHQSCVTSTNPSRRVYVYRLGPGNVGPDRVAHLDHAACDEVLTLMYSATFWREFFPRSLFTLSSLLSVNVLNGSSMSPTEESVPKLRRHPRYWLDDGSLVVRTQDDLFKVHRTLLQRHSPVLTSLVENSLRDDAARVDGCPILHLPSELGVDSADFEALLEHLYHDRCAPKAIYLYPC